MSTANGSRGAGRVRWWLVAVPAVVVLAVLGYLFRPAPSVDADAGGPVRQRAVLIEASARSALILLPDTNGGQPTMVAWSAEGGQKWTSPGLGRRVIITCAPNCSSAYGSANEQSFTRPEVPDPPVLTAGKSGDGQVSRRSEPRQRVLWAGSGGQQVVSAAAALGQALSIDSVAGDRTAPLAKDVKGDALFLADGSRAVIMTHPTTTSAAAVFLRHGPSGWRREGGPVPIGDFAGGCFAVVGDEPTLVAYREGAAEVVTPGRARPLPDTLQVGQCTLNSTGPVLASFGVNGTGTSLSQRDSLGREVWAKSLTGVREVSARPSHAVVTASEGSLGEVAFLGAGGAISTQRRGVAAKVLDSGLVLVNTDGKPVWQQLP